MARKRETQLRIPIDNQEDWNAMLSKPGLCVVDVYQDWCQPCIAIESIFKRIKNELGDDLLQFAVAKSDTVDSLVHYRGRCQPCFLFYAGGTLVAQKRGLDAPLLSKMIVDELQREHKVISGDIVRKEIKDPNIKTVQVEKTESATTDHTNKIVAVAIVKPDVIQQGKLDEILEIIKSSGIEILKREDRQLTEVEARQLYTHIEGEEYYNDVIEYICSGISCILAISKSSPDSNVINEIRKIIGPKNVEEAKTSEPNSVRAIYGKSKLINAIHGSSDEYEAHSELSYFFPDFQIGSQDDTSSKNNHTLALIRPDGVANFKDSILSDIQQQGFKVVASKEIQLSRNQAEDFYENQKGKDHYETLIEKMTSGVSMALILEKNNSVSEWRKLLGPKINAANFDPGCLRAKFKLNDVPINLIHGSSSQAEADKEIEYFFPIQQSLAIILSDENQDSIMGRIQDEQFTVHESISFRGTEDLLKLIFSEEVNMDLIDEISGKIMTCVVVSKIDAISELQKLAGPEDLETARNEAPSSIRAHYGRENGFNGMFCIKNSQQFETYLKCIKESQNSNTEAEESPEISQDKDESHSDQDVKNTEAPTSQNPSNEDVPLNDEMNESEESGENKSKNGEKQDDENFDQNMI